MQITKGPLTGLAKQINFEHKQAFGAARNALNHARKAGELLIQAKAQTAHGEWLAWLTTNCEFSVRTAQGYMRLGERWPELESKYATVAHLGLRDALALLSEPKRLEPHEYCLIFPPMTDEEYEDLKSSLRLSGFLESMPITLLDGQILDGKERYRACLELGVEPKFQTFEDVIAAGYRGEALDFVKSANLTRQHLGQDRRERFMQLNTFIHEHLSKAREIMDALAEIGRDVSWKIDDSVVEQALATNGYLRDVLAGLREHGKELSSAEIMRVLQAGEGYSDDVPMLQVMALTEIGGILNEENGLSRVTGK